MSELTKKALAQALIRLLEDRDLEKITVREITDACGLTRNTFYYHFHDVYGILSWFFADQAEDIMKKHRQDEDWQGGLEEALTFLYEHQRMIRHVYRSISYDTLVSYVNEILYRHARGVVAMEAENRNYSNEEGINLVADFYTNAMIGAVLSWIREDMPDDPAEMARTFNRLFVGTVESALMSADSPDKM